MTDAASGGRFDLSRRRYLWLDRATKLVGIGLVAIGLEIGGDTAPGLVAAGLGAAIGLATVFIQTNE